PADPAQAVLSDGNASPRRPRRCARRRLPTNSQNDGVVRRGRSRGPGELVASDASGIATVCDRCSYIAPTTRPRGAGDAVRQLLHCSKNTPCIDFLMKAGTVIRQLSILTLVTVLVGGVQPGHAHPQSSPP